MLLRESHIPIVERDQVLRHVRTPWHNIGMAHLLASRLNASLKLTPMSGGNSAVRASVARSRDAYPFRRADVPKAAARPRAAASDGAMILMTEFGASRQPPARRHPTRRSMRTIS